MKEWEVEPIDLFEWLKAMPLFPKFYWANREGDLAIAGVGNSPVPQLQLFGWRQFCKTQGEEWQDFPSSMFISPRFELKQMAKKFIFRESDSSSPRLAKRQEPLSHPFYTIQKQLSLPNRQEWTSGIERALKAIQTKQFEKVVLARRVTFDCTSAIDPISICSKLSGPGQTSFFFQPTPSSAFVSATPERLYRRTFSQIECDALAGTRPKDHQNELLQSDKELREFGIVKKSILDALAPLCSSMPTASPTKILQTPTISHLHSQILGELKKEMDDDALLDALHPTPAVGGWPRNEALSFLSSFESFARGLYAAPIGWKSPDAAEFAVGIRSCLIQGSRAYLYAGTGIVEGSDPLLEWEESEQKLAQWNSIFL